MKTTQKKTKKNLKVSFDFDDCLADNQHLQTLASILAGAGTDVFILTARIKENINNKDLLEKAKEIGIPEQNIIFAGFSPKHQLMKKHNIDIHFDDNADTVDKINRFFDSPMSTNKRAFLVNLDLGEVLNTFWEFKE